MKQYIFKFFCFYLLLTSCAFAGNTSLTSYYPPPTAAYNKINVATNYTSSLCKNTVNVCCPGGNSGTTYYDTTHQALYICGAVLTSSPANGSIHADSNGTVHVVMGGQDVVFPSECLNKFCSYNITSGNTCNSGNCSYMALPGGFNVQGSCPSGFVQTSVNSSLVVASPSTWYDLLQTSPTTCVAAIVCCTSSLNTGLLPTSTGYPPDENTTSPP